MWKVKASGIQKEIKHWGQESGIRSLEKSTACLLLSLCYRSVLVFSVVVFLILLINLFQLLQWLCALFNLRGNQLLPSIRYSARYWADRWNAVSDFKQISRRSASTYKQSAHCCAEWIWSVLCEHGGLLDGGRWRWPWGVLRGDFLRQSLNWAWRATCFRWVRGGSTFKSLASLGTDKKLGYNNVHVGDRWKMKRKWWDGNRWWRTLDVRGWTLPQGQGKEDRVLGQIFILSRSLWHQGGECMRKTGTESREQWEGK